MTELDFLGGPTDPLEWWSSMYEDSNPLKEKINELIKTPIAENSVLNANDILALYLIHMAKSIT